MKREANIIKISKTLHVQQFQSLCSTSNVVLHSFYKYFYTVLRVQCFADMRISQVPTHPVLRPPATAPAGGPGPSGPCGPAGSPGSRAFSVAWWSYGGAEIC